MYLSIRFYGLNITARRFNELPSVPALTTVRSLWSGLAASPIDFVSDAETVPVAQDLISRLNSSRIDFWMLR
jgi:hypothetical protein